MQSENNRFEQLVQGLYQYTGAIIDEFEGEPEEKAHIAVARLSEAWLSHCLKDGSDDYCYYQAKPLLRAAAVLLRKRAEKIRSLIDERVPGLEKYKIEKMAEGYIRAADIIKGFTESVQKGV